MMLLLVWLKAVFVKYRCTLFWYLQNRLVYKLKWILYACVHSPHMYMNINTYTLLYTSHMSFTLCAFSQTWKSVHNDKHEYICIISTHTDIFATTNINMQIQALCGRQQILSPEKQYEWIWITCHLTHSPMNLFFIPVSIEPRSDDVQFSSCLFSS